MEQLYYSGEPDSESIAVVSSRRILTVNRKNRSAPAAAGVQPPPVTPQPPCLGRQYKRVCGGYR